MTAKATSANITSESFFFMLRLLLRQEVLYDVLENDDPRRLVDPSDCGGEGNYL